MRHLLILLLFVSCDQKPNSQFQNSVDQNRVDKVYEKMSKAYEKLDIDGIRNIYFEDAAYLTGGEEMGISNGMEDFIVGFDGMFAYNKENNSQLSLKFKIAKRESKNGDLVADAGIYKLTRTTSDGEQSHSFGKFITVLKPDDQGNYKFIMDGFSPTTENAYQDLKSINN